MKPGDIVTHPDFPNDRGILDGVAVINRVAYYRVIWPWPASPGPVIFYAVSTSILKKI